MQTNKFQPYTFDVMINPIHEANRARWDAAAASWAQAADSRGLWSRCASEPELVLSERERFWLGDLRGKKVVVLGSGDNQAAFALAGLGAKVTSVDISQRQLDIAMGRAQTLGLRMEFVRADVTDLSAFEDSQFDIAYTGGHVAVWVADLDRFYAEATRVLRRGGLLIVAEYHPFRCIWRKPAQNLEVGVSYFARGPHRSELSADILNPEPGEFATYEFHWTVADYVSALLKSGCALSDMHEFGTYVGDWEGAPLDGLPEYLLMVGTKQSAPTDE